MTAIGNVSFVGSCIYPQSECLYEEEKVASYPYYISHLGDSIRYHFGIVDSTQMRARQLLSHRTDEQWFVISAEEQMEGKGTYGRPWHSPAHDNLYVTFILPFPECQSEKLFFISQVATIAVARTLKQFGCQPEIKWPNDVMLNKKKVGGILCETTTPISGETQYALLLGVGLNVNMEQAQCDMCNQPVSSLAVEAKRPFDKEQVLSALDMNLKICIRQLLEKDFASFRDELNSMLAFKNELVTIETRDMEQSFKGTFVGIDEVGRMRLLVDDTVITLDDGRIRHISKQVEAAVLPSSTS